MRPRSDSTFLSHQYPIVHKRIRNLLAKHNRLPLLVNTEHPIPLVSPELSNQRLEAANRRLMELNDNILSQQPFTGSSSDLRQQLDRAENALSRYSVRTTTRGRHHLGCIEVANIFHSNLRPGVLASAYHCCIDTIYRIKRNPLSRYGLSARQFRTIIKDLKDSNLMTWFSNSSGVTIPTLPPVDFQNRCGPDRKLTAVHAGTLKYILEMNPDMYLDEIREALVFLDPNLDISLPTLSRFLLRMGYNKTKSSKVISKADENTRMIFAAGISLLVSDLNQLVFLDECTNARNSLNRTTSRSAAQISSRGSNRAPTSRVSFIGAISTQGLVEFSLYEGTISSSEFEDFVKFSLLPAMNPYPDPLSVLVLDNASAHSSSLIAYAAVHHQVMVLFLPPYSPDLNPIERFFSSVKAAFKRFVGQSPELRRRPYLLWLMALAHCNSVVNYPRLINDTYRSENMNITVQIN